MTTPVGVSELGGLRSTALHDSSDHELLALVATDVDGTAAIETLFLRHLAFARRFVQSCGGTPSGVDADILITDAFGELFLAVRAGNGPTDAVVPAIALTLGHRLGVAPPELSSRSFLKLDDHQRAALLVCAFTGGEADELVPAIAADEQAASQLLDGAVAQLRSGRAPAAALLRRRLAAATIAVLLLGGAGVAWALSRATNSIDVIVPAPPSDTSNRFAAPPRDSKTDPKAASATTQAAVRSTSSTRPQGSPARSDGAQPAASSTTAASGDDGSAVTALNPASAASSATTQPSAVASTASPASTAGSAGTTTTTGTANGGAATTALTSPTPAAPSTPTQPPATAAPPTAPPPTRSAPTTSLATTTTTTTRPTTTTTAPTTTTTKPPPTTTRPVTSTTTTRDTSGPSGAWQPPGVPGEVPDGDIPPPGEDDN